MNGSIYKDEQHDEADEVRQLVLKLIAEGPFVFHVNDAYKRVQQDVYVAFENEPDAGSLNVVAQKPWDYPAIAFPCVVKPSYHHPSCEQVKSIKYHS